MIKEVEGDILLSRADAIAHGVAPMDHFNSGLALSLREQWPQMYKDFRHFCHQGSVKSGAVWFWAGPNVKIFNLLTQEAPENEKSNPGKATLSYVGHALEKLADELKSNGIKSVALPRLATGVGGLKWEDVRPLIKKHLDGVGIPVYVYVTYHKGVKAAE